MATWRVLLGGLEPSWGVILGTWRVPWAALRVGPVLYRFLARFLAVLGVQRGAQGEPKSTKNGAKIDAKTRSKFKSPKNALRERLGPMWGQIGCHFEGPARVFALAGSSRIDFLDFHRDQPPRRVFHPTWPSWTPKVAKMTPQRPPKRSPKTTENRSKKTSKKRRGFASLLVP